MSARGSYPGYGEVLHFGRLRGAPAAELLHARFGRFDFARHAHDRVSFGLITAGAMRLEQAGGASLVGAGDVILYNHDVVHWGGSERGQGCDAGWAIRTLYADPGQLASTPPCGRKPPRPSPRNTPTSPLPALETRSSLPSPFTSWKVGRG